MRYFLFIISALFMLFACSIDDVVKAEASETTQCKGNDFDVGFHVTETSAATVATQIPVFDCIKAIVVPGASMNYEANATTCESTTYAVAIRPKALTCNYWEGGTTKASPCKSVRFTYLQKDAPFSTPYAFGRDIRRLSFEDKA